MANISRKEHCGGCGDKKPLRSANQVITSKSLLPCSFGTSKLITGEIANNNFDGDLTLVTANTELITVDNDVFNFTDVPLDDCGGKLKAKGHSHLTLSEEFKKRLEILGANGSIEDRITNIFNTKEFKLGYVTYLRRLIEDGLLRASDLGLTLPTLPSDILTCSNLSTCKTFSDLVKDFTQYKLVTDTAINSLSTRVYSNEVKISQLELEVSTLKVLLNTILSRLNSTPVNTQPTQPTPEVKPTLSNISRTIREEDTNKQVVSLEDLNRAYFDASNSPIASIYIGGGDLDKFRFDGQPIFLGKTIPVSEINKLTFVGTGDATLTVRAINQNNKESNMANFTIQYQRIADSFERCVRISRTAGTQSAVTIVRNEPNNNTQFGSLTFTNSCGTSYQIPEQVLINENGLKVFIPAFTLNGNETVTKPYIVSGTYTGAKSTITGSININGGTDTVTITVQNQNTPPVTRDVTRQVANRTNGEIRATDLDWSDAQSDTLQAVRFVGDVSRLFTNPERTTPYVAGTELQPNFVIYHKAPDQDPEFTYTFQYNVKAGGQWSV